MNIIIIPKWARKITLLAVIFLTACDLGVGSSWWSSDEPIVVRELPDFSALQDVKMKKKAFFDFLRPIVQIENEKVNKQRQRMMAMRDKLDDGKRLGESESAWLLKLAADYNVDMVGTSDEKAWTLLKRRVDTVPFRLALAQAANESSWGTSRFARQGLNLFGQWCFKPGCGIVPSKRQTGMTHEVATYVSVNESVARYIRSINRVQMYTPLRKLRHSIKKRGARPSAVELAQELSGYSERGDDYVSEIQSMIRKNYDLMSGDLSIAQKGA